MQDLLQREHIRGRPPTWYIPIHVLWDAEYITSSLIVRFFESHDLGSAVTPSRQLGTATAASVDTKNTECTKPKRCSDCGGCHHKMLNCLTNRSLSSANSPAQGASMYSPSTQRQLATSPMNPAAASFTSQPRTTSTTPNPTRGFLGHILGEHDIRDSHRPPTSRFVT